jgi:hypothetical protein
MGNNMSDQETHLPKLTREKTQIVKFMEDEDGDDINVCVNGKAWQIQRGVEVELPLSVLHVLNNAQTTIINKKGQTRNVLRFPYTAVVQAA